MGVNPIQLAEKNMGRILLLLAAPEVSRQKYDVFFPYIVGESFCGWLKNAKKNLR
jgi:hypothetical protein